MKLSFTMHSGKYTRFEADAFIMQIGKVVNVSWGIETNRGRLVNAVVSEDGSAVDIVVEVSQDIFPSIRIW